MKELYVPDYEWNAHYNSPEECVEQGKEVGDFKEGEEFSLVRLQVFAKTTYKIVDGKPVPVSLAFPDQLLEIAEQQNGGGKP